MDVSRGTTLPVSTGFSAYAGGCWCCGKPGTEGVWIDFVKAESEWFVLCTRHYRMVLGASVAPGVVAGDEGVARLRGLQEERAKEVLLLELRANGGRGMWIEPTIDDERSET